MKNEEKWWQRLFRVIYITLYVPLILVVPVVWKLISPNYIETGRIYKNTYEKTSLLPLLTLFIYMITIRLIKIVVLYVAIGQKPEWKKEFNKLY